MNLLNARSASGSVTRFIKVRAHRGEPLNEAADALAAAAAESDPSRSLALDLDADTIYYSFRRMWVEYDSRIREELIQRAAKLCVTRILRSKSRRASQEGSSPALPLTTTWLLRQGHGREMLGKVLGEMRISTANKIGTPVYSWIISVQCGPSQEEICAISGLRSLRSPCRNTGSHPVFMPRP